MNPTNEQIRDLLPGYVLGILEPETMLAIKTYLKEQEELLRQAQSAEDALALMALTTPPVRPPAAIKQVLLHRVEQDAVRRSLPVVAPPPLEIPRPTHAAQRWQMPAPVRTAIATAAVVAVIMLGMYIIGLNQRVATLLAEQQSQTAQVAALTAQNLETAALADELRATITTLQTEREQLVAETAQLADSNADLNLAIEQISQELALDQNRLQLLSTASAAVMLDEGNAAPQSRGAFYVSGPQGVLIVHGLEPLPESQVYQFWWVTPDGAQVPVAPVEVHAGVEPTWVVVDVPAQTAPFSVVGLSIEPAGGSPQPTGPMVLEGSVPG